VLVHQPLYRGIELVVVPAFNLEVFCKTIQDHKITFVYVAPPIVVHLARSELVKKYDLTSLKMITSGAAPLTKELVDTVYEKLKIKINQAYGLTETSPMTHAQVCMAVVCQYSRPDTLRSASDVIKALRLTDCHLAMGGMVQFCRLCRQAVPEHVCQICLTRGQRAGFW
jgi:acyl-coenzyme A synthetase/AMP-(fatty) acid ligase